MTRDLHRREDDQAPDRSARREPAEDDYDFDDESDTEPCPECGEEIYEDSDQCPKCGADVALGSNVWSGRPWWWKLLGILGIGAMILGLMLLSAQ